jgi:TolA-binding protein
VYRKYHHFAALVAALTILIGLGLRASRADEGEDQFATAARHYSQQRWELAAHEFSGLLKNHPDHGRAAWATFFLGESLVRLERYGEATVRFHDLLKRFPDNRYAAQALFRAGESAYLSGDGDAALKDLNQFSSDHPNDQLTAYALAYVGRIELRQGHVEAARNAFETAERRFPGQSKQQGYEIGLAQVFEAQNKLSEAIKVYRRIADDTTHPQSGRAQFMLGTLQYALGQYKQAAKTLEAFDHSRRDDSFRSKTRLNRAWSLYQLKKYDEAAEILNDLGTDPKVLVSGRYALGVVLAASGKHDEAAKRLIAAAALNPRHPLVPAIRSHAGEALLHLKRLDEAKEQFDFVLQSAPKSSWIDECLLGKLRIASQRKNHSQIDTLAGRIEKQFAGTSAATDAKRILARSYLARGMHDKATALLEALGPADQPSLPLSDRFVLARSYENAGQYEKALKLLAEIATNADAKIRGRAQLERGTILRKLSRFGEAITPLKKYLETKPTGELAANARAQLAICHMHQGETHKAKFVYRRLLGDQPTDELLLTTSLHLAEGAYAAGDHDWAASLFKRVAKKGNPADYVSKGLAGLAWCQLKNQRAEDSLDTFERLLREHPNSAAAPDAALTRGRMLAERGNHGGAIVMFGVVLGRYPKSLQAPAAQLAFAQALDAVDQDDQSVAAYRKFLASHPQNQHVDAALYELAWLLRDGGDAKQAESLFARLYNNHRNSFYWPDAAYRMAQSAADQQDAGRAVKLLKEVVAANPDASVMQHALYLQGQVAASQKDWGAVKTPLERLATDYPDSSLVIPARYWIAEATYREGEYAEAGRLFGALAKQIGKRRDGWMAMIPLRQAQVLAQQKRWQEAKVIARRAEKQSPRFAQMYEVHYLLGRCLASEADFSAARRRYRQVIHSAAGRKTETAAMAQWMIGETFFHQEAYDDAAAAYLKVEVLYPYARWQAGSLLQAGKCYEQMKQWDHAVKLYDRLVKKYPDTTFTGEGKRRLTVARQRADAKTF